MLNMPCVTSLTLLLVQVLLVNLLRSSAAAAVEGKWLPEKWKYVPLTTKYQDNSAYTDDDFYYFYAYRSLKRRGKNMLYSRGFLDIKAAEDMCTRLSGGHIQGTTSPGSWKLLSVTDVARPNFQKFIWRQVDFLPFTNMYDGLKFNMLHTFILKSLRIPVLHSFVEQELKVTLTIQAYSKFQVEVDYLNSTKKKPIDIICVRRVHIPKTTTSTTPATTTSVTLKECPPFSSPASVQHPLTGGSYSPSVRSLDSFLVQHRATLFAVTTCSVALLILLGVLLACLSRRYRALSRHRCRVPNGYRSPRSPPDGVSGCSSATAPLWPKNYTGPGTPSPVEQHYLQPHPPHNPKPHSQTNGTAKVVHVPSADAELGAIAARRFRDTLRRSEHAGINSSGAVYTTLHQRETLLPYEHDDADDDRYVANSEPKSSSPRDRVL